MGIVWSKQRTYLVAGSLAAILLLVSMFFALQKPVAISVDGKVVTKRVFFGSTVGEVLKASKIALGEKDKVLPDLNTPIKKNTDITVLRAFKVKIIADGQTKEIFTTPVSVKEAIAMAGFNIGDKDLVKTLPGDTTVPDQDIEIIRVTEKMVEEQQPVPFQVERSYDNNLENGLTRTIRAGQDGVALNTIKVTYQNNKEVNRQVIASKSVKDPVNKVIAMGTITTVSRGGLRLDFHEARIMQTSAYTYTGSNTASGEAPEVGKVAVDPSVIPLGTRLYVEGYGYAVASDTGGAIKGDRLDLFMEDRGQCVAWGRRTAKVYVLK
ncbi:MAG TPA: 3D domain-containing protein [Syntrophomonadaceae bacterium]|nr:3D domain-containing protein [Syntrophomonadaceae bacterium]